MPPGSSDDPPNREQTRREYPSPWSTLGLALAVIAVVGGFVWWFEFRGAGDGEAIGDAPGIVALPPDLNPTGEAPEATPGRVAPDFELRSPDGALVRLSSFRGTPVLVNFWASWCGPCRAEAPDLNDLEADLSDHLVVLGVNQQESLSAVEEFVGEFSLSYPIVLDRDGGVSLAYRVGRGLPVSFLVSSDGVVLRAIAGRLREDDLAEIRQVAAP